MSKSIQIENLGVVYNDHGGPFVALDDMSFSVGAGEFVSIIGASGCGKSTLLGVLEGLLKPTAGRASIDGVAIDGPGPERSVVFQQYSLFPWMTALGNVEFAIKQARADLKAPERKELARHFLNRVYLGGFENRFPKQLSGGQQQRVAIARALAQDADILLMDEPFGAIDARNRSILQDLLLELWESDGAGRKTVVFITHDLEEAILLGDRIVMMQPSPGRVRAQFEVPLPRPRHRLEMLRDPNYIAFRSRLSEIFFADEIREVHSA